MKEKKCDQFEDDLKVTPPNSLNDYVMVLLITQADSYQALFCDHINVIIHFTLKTVENIQEACSFM